MKSSTDVLAAPTSASGPSAPTQHNGQDGRSHPSTHKRVRVLVADDHPVVRRGLTACLEQMPRVELVGEAADGREALFKTRELLPDILLTDNDMPHLSGLAVTEALRKELPRIKVLILSLQSDPEYVLRCAQAGAKGYIFKDASPDEVVRAIEAISAGQPYFSPDVAQVALNRFVRGKPGTPDLAQLTHREREVLVHIAEGLYNKEIASRLNIGTRTVETHRHRLMRKLGIHSIAGLTRFAVAKGLITSPAPSLA